MKCKDLNNIYSGDGLAAIYVKVGTQDTMYYVHKDNLGSYNVIWNNKNSAIQTMSFDACPNL